MKTRNLFLSLFAFAAVCACNKEADPVGPEQLDGETYIAVTIKQPSDASTRAPQDAGFEYGTDAENAVNTAKFILYDSYGKYIIDQDVTISTWTDAANPADNVEEELTVRLQEALGLYYDAMDIYESDEAATTNSFAL